MPTPIPSNLLRDLTARARASVCGEAIAGLRQWNEAMYQHFAWLFQPARSNGVETGQYELSDEFAADVQALDCRRRTEDEDGGGAGTCPPVAISATLTAGNTTVNLRFDGSNLTSGYAWRLYRSTVAGAFADPAVSSGTTTGGTITYNDSGLTNGTAYYYKLEVQKTGCPVYELQTSSVTPTVATVAPALRVVVTPACGGFSWLATLSNASGMTVDFYARTAADAEWSLVSTGSRPSAGSTEVSQGAAAGTGLSAVYVRAVIHQTGEADLEATAQAGARYQLRPPSAAGMSGYWAEWAQDSCGWPSGAVQYRVSVSGPATGGQLQQIGVTSQLRFFIEPTPYRQAPGLYRAYVTAAAEGESSATVPVGTFVVPAVGTF